jgi:hypothetical protein
MRIVANIVVSRTRERETPAAIGLETTNARSSGDGLLAQPCGRLPFRPAPVVTTGDDLIPSCVKK